MRQKTNVYDYFLNRTNVLQRVNKHVMAKGTYFDLSYRGALVSTDCVSVARLIAVLPLCLRSQQGTGQSCGDV